MRKEGICTAIIFYDLYKKFIDFKGLFTFLEEWFLKQGYTPMRGSVHGEGIKATKTKTFKHVKKVILEKDPKTLTSFWFGAYPSEWDDDMFDALLSVGVSMRSRGVFDLYFHNDLIPYERNYIENLIKDISKYLKAYYGIVYQRDFNKGPGLYAHGYITGLNRYTSPPEVGLEMDKISKWHNTYFFDDGGYILGHLRDIYPINLLSETHLKQPIFDTTLKEWIESSSDHGELKLLTDILWEWWVPEEKISAVREALRTTGLLICV